MVLLSLALVLAIAERPAAAADWQSAALFGADVRSLAVDPARPDVVYAGTATGQVYVSTNGGAGWQNAGASLPFPGWVVSKLVFDPNRPGPPGRLWAALWGIWGGGQVASSDDGGKTWAARSGGLPDSPVYSLALAPGKEGRLYAGTGQGVWGSEDGGASWRPLTTALPELAKVTSLLVDATQPEIVLAGTWRQAYRSQDAGRTWSGVFQGMVLDSEVFSLTPLPDRPGEIWATTCGWVYHSFDRGDSWLRFQSGFVERRVPSFAVLANGRLLAGTVAGLHASDDGGKTWARIGDPALSILAITQLPAGAKEAGRVILGTEGSGIWISSDGGNNFVRASRGMTNVRVAALAETRGELLAAMVHAGPLSGVYSSRDGGLTFSEDFAPLPTVLDLGVQQDRVYAATEKGLFVRLGKGWHRVPELKEERVEQVLASGPRLLVRTADRLWERRGETWAALPGTTRSAAFFAGVLWAAESGGIVPLPPASGTLVPAPTGGGKLSSLGDRLLWVGNGGAWTRWESSWMQLSKEPSRAFATGDPRYPALGITGGTARLWDREAGHWLPVELPIPARDVASARISGGKLVLGTSGYGVLVQILPAV